MGHRFSGLSCYPPQTGTCWVGGGLAGDSWVPMHLNSILLARGIPSSILSRNKSPALPPQYENKLYFLLW